MGSDLKENIKNAVLEYYNKNKESKNSSEYIHASGKVLDFDDLFNLIDSSLDMWLTAGRYNTEFESAFAQYLGTKYALTVNSGSSANLLALTALTSNKLKERAIKKGDEVITTACAFPTTVNPIIQNGLIPVFIDIEPDTYNINAEQIEKAVTEKTKCIFLAHTLGHCFNIAKVKEICEKYGLWLIEDSCDALGAKYGDKRTGTFGDIATFSFYPAHHITMGEGGAIATSDSMLYKIIKSYRDWGRDCSCPPGVDGICGKRFSQKLGSLPYGYDHKYTYSHIGYNLKITDMQAAIGCSQLKKLPQFLKKRKENALYLTEKLSDLTPYLRLPKSAENCEHSWFGYLITIKPNSGFTKQELVSFLETNNVGTRHLFAGNILRQPYFTENEILLRINSSEILNSKNLTEADYKLLPETENVMNNTFWAGVYPALEKEDLDVISEKIHDFIKEHGRR